MTLVLAGPTATASGGTSATPDYLVASTADAADIALGDMVVLTNSGGTYKQSNVFTVTGFSSAFGFTNISFAPAANAVTVNGDILKVVVDDWTDQPKALPISIRLKNPRTDLHIEHQVRDHSFRIAIPGGFASATFTLDRPLSMSPDELGLFTSVYVYDTRHGGTLWEGQLEDPGRGSSESGEVWQLSAIGPSNHVRDTVAAYILIDKSLERWHRSRYSTSLGRTEQGEQTDTTAGVDESLALIIRAEQGVTVSTSWQGDFIYRSIFYAGQSIARLRCEFNADTTSTDYQQQMVFRTGNGAGIYTRSENWTPFTGTMAENYGSGLPTAANVGSFRAVRNNTATTATAVTSAYFWNVSIRAALKYADGTNNYSTSDYTANNVDPVEVVADLLGRFLARYDGANAVLIGSGVDIDQLAYPDGVSPGEVLEDLAVYDPGFYWAAWETTESTGKYRFEYVPWPLTVRYEASTIDGFDSPGSAADLYNQVHVRYRDPVGIVRNMVRTQTVAELSNATPPITRTAYIDLSDETGTVTAAAYAGDNFLAEHRYPPNAGTLTIARPVLDNNTGRMVQPWELRPGCLIRVSGVVPRVDSLNPTARDGVTVFKVVSVDFSSSTASSTLELDSYSRTVARQLASLRTRRLRKR